MTILYTFIEGGVVKGGQQLLARFYLNQMNFNHTIVVRLLASEFLTPHLIQLNKDTAVIPIRRIKTWEQITVRSDLALYIGFPYIWSGFQKELQG